MTIQFNLSIFSTNWNFLTFFLQFFLQFFGSDKIFPFCIWHQENEKKKDK